ncbi:hypothetical protein BH23BAC1_BH23BAC1_27220 [soil metagenome]
MPLPFPFFQVGSPGFQSLTCGANFKSPSFKEGLRENYSKVTLRDFATMTSGYCAPGDSRWGEASADWSPEPYIPCDPLFAPGSQFAYWDEAQMMFGKVLTQLAIEDMLEIVPGGT